MPTSPDLGITHVDPAQSQKATTVNAAIDSLDQAIAGDLELDCSAGGTITLTSAQWINMVLHLIGASGGAFNIVVPAANKKLYLVDNASGQTATVKTASGTGIAVLPGTVQFVRCDGTNVVSVNAVSTSNHLTWGAAAPASGTWAQGDVCFNTGAVAGGNAGWICVVAGTSGTWKPFGPIAA
jgi:hypothetical protein